MSKSTVLNLAETMLEVEAFEIFLGSLEENRKEKPEKFIHLIISYLKKEKNVEVNYLFHRLKLTDEEIILLIRIGWLVSTPIEKIEGLLLLQKIWLYWAKIGQVGTTELHQLGITERQEILRNLEFTDKELNIIRLLIDKRPIEEDPLLPNVQWKIQGWKVAGLDSVTPEPSGEELLKTALQKIIDEKKFRGVTDYLRFVNPRIEKAYPKNAKPYTNEQLTKGIEWFVATRKKIAGKKAITDQRSRSRFNVSNREWNAFMFEQFGIRNPVFTKQYQKNVRDEVSKILKEQTAQNSSK